MNTLINFLVIIGIAVTGYLVWRLTQQLQKPKEEDQSMKMLQEHLFQIQKGLKDQDKSMNDQMNKSRDTIAEYQQKQFASTAKMIKDMMESTKSVTEKLTKLDETNKQVVGFAEQMKSLENILKNFYLTEMLKVSIL